MISVLIPCYNAAAFVGEAVESVLAQDVPDLEIVVVDDGSTDGSGDVVASFVGRGVKLLRQANRGQCAAANAAYRASSGSLIKFFDADDVMLPGMLSRQVERLAGRTDAIAMGEWARFEADPGTAVFRPLPMYRDAKPDDWLVGEWMNALPMMQCALWLVPRPIIEKAGLWDERLSLINDFEYFTRVLLAADEILYSPGARLAYRSNVAGSLSSRKGRSAAESAQLSLLTATRTLLAKADTPRARLACANILQNFDYDFFPDYADLRAAVRREVSRLGGADLEPVGPPRFHALRKLVGWRAARLVQRAAGR